MRPRSVALSIALGAVAVLTLTACGGGSGAVSAELSEWKLVLGASSAAAGDVTFDISNKGANEHEFVILKTDTAAAELPVTGGVVDEGGVTVVDEVEDIAAGATAKLTAKLDAGHYAIVCNVSGHYEQGMRADFEAT